MKIAQVSLEDKELEFLADKIQQHLADSFKTNEEAAASDDPSADIVDEEASAAEQEAIQPAKKNKGKGKKVEEEPEADPEQEEGDDAEETTEEADAVEPTEDIDDYRNPDGTIMMFEDDIMTSSVTRRLAKEWPSKEALEDYLKEHPNADREKHWVKQQKPGKAAPEEDTEGKPGKAPKKQQERGTPQTIDMKLEEKFGHNAKHWSQHALHESQVHPKTMVVMPDGNRSEFGKLGKADQKAVMEAVTTGKAAHMGFTNYGHKNPEDVNIGTFRGNVQTSLGGSVNKKVKERKNKNKEELTRTNVDQFSADLRSNGRSVIERHASITSDVSRPMLEKHLDLTVRAIDEGVKDGSIKGVSQSEIDEYVREDLKRIMHQEVESRRRSLGDHGIRHATSNAANTNTMLEELERGGQNITGQQKLMALSAQANHDMGYTIGRAAVDVTVGSDPKEGHKAVSARLMGEERPRYEKVFGKQGTDQLLQIVATHDEGNKIDWEHDPVASAVRLADTTAMFGKDKVQDLFIRSPQAMKLAGKLYMAAQHTPLEPKKPKREKFKDDESFATASKKYAQDKAEFDTPETQQRVKEGQEMQATVKKHLHEVVDNGKFHPVDRDAMHSAIDEMTEGQFSSSLDVLSRFSGTLQGFKYDHENKVMHARMSYSPEGQIVGAVFGDEASARQFSKTAKDMNAQAVKGNRGNIVLTSSITGKPAAQLDIDGVDDKPIDRATNTAMREFLTKTARGSLLEAVKHISPPPDTKKADVDQAMEDMEESHDLFTDGEWDEMMAVFHDHKSDPEALAGKLRSYPLTEAEKGFLTTVTASVTAGIEDGSPFSALIEAANSTGRGRGKDKDLMRDTGGVQKHRVEPKDKPTRDDVKKRYKPDQVHKEDKDDLTRDTKQDPDLKLSSVPRLWQVSVPFSGVLKIDRRPGKLWGMLELDDALRTSIFNAMDLEDVWSDPDNDAHISVFSDDEVRQLPRPLPEEGEVYTFTAKGISSVEPEDWRGVDEVVMVIVDAPELSQLRAKYGFPPLMYGHHQFHITLAVKKEDE